MRQFNVQLYVEKVFIAQKTSEDRGGKVRKRVKDTELLGRLTGKGIGGRAGWRVRRRDGRGRIERGGEDTSPDRVIISRDQGKEARDDDNLIERERVNGTIPRSNAVSLEDEARTRELARCSAHERTGRAVPSPAHADFKWY